MGRASGSWIVYFCHTANLAVVTPGLAKALCILEKEADPGDAKLAAIVGDLEADDREAWEALKPSGLLSPGLAWDGAMTDDLVERFLAHQPRNLMLFVTNACNLACTYCYELNQGVHSNGRHMKRSLAQETIDEYFAQSPGRRELAITFFGGEPLLNFSLIQETVEYAQQKALASGVSLGFTMTSNLTLMTGEMAEFLVREKFRVMVSVDGDQETHDEHRVYKDGSGSYNDTIRNLKTLNRMSVAAGIRPPKARATLSPGDQTADDVRAALKREGIDLIMVGSSMSETDLVDPWGDDGERHAAESFGRAMREIQVAIEVAQDGGLLALGRDISEAYREVATKLKGKRPGPPQPHFCGVCRNMKAVSSDGKIYPCHRYVGMPAFEMGNVGAEGAANARVEEYYRGLVASWKESCSTCWANHLCGGTCPWVRSSSDGVVKAPDEAVCDRIRSSKEHVLELIALSPEAARAAASR